MRTNEQGRSMIEMLGVLAIVGVLSVGGIAGYSKAMNKFKTNKAIDQVNMLSTNIRTLYSSQRNYNGLNNLTAAKVGVVPEEMYDPKTVSASATDVTLNNPFGGTTVVEAAAHLAANDDLAFTITINKVPQASCVSIVTTEWGSDVGSGLLAIYAGSNDTSSTIKGVTTGLTASANLAKAGDSTYGLPFSIVNASTSCANTANFITWKYL